ncbi:MAG: dehydratase [Chloroflexi bacterium]|nr:dehydratase [Chloroflexota bacterium]
MARYHYYEDYPPDLQMTTPARTIGETEVSMFAMLTGDFNRLHTDAEYMKDSPFGERIAHGLLGLSIVNGLKYRTDLDPDGIIAFLGLQWSFTAPIRFGDTIHAVLRMASQRTTKHPERGIITFGVNVINQHADVVQQGEMTMMVKRRPVE